MEADPDEPDPFEDELGPNDPEDEVWVYPDPDDADPDGADPDPDDTGPYYTPALGYPVAP